MKLSPLNSEVMAFEGQVPVISITDNTILEQVNIIHIFGM
jgi:hypothetical protein